MTGRIGSVALSVDNVGQETFLFGTVVSINDETTRIRVDGGTYTLRVRSFDAAVDPGGTVQVLGVMRSDDVLVADRVVVESSGSSRLYNYEVSVLGAGLVLVAFFRHWRIDTEQLAFEVQDGWSPDACSRGIHVDRCRVMAHGGSTTLGTDCDGWCCDSGSREDQVGS